jgi:hypothetical protein
VAGPHVPNGVGPISGVNLNGDSCDHYQNLYRDPEFRATGDYHLTSGSPCINAADPGLPHDSDGTIADIGAFGCVVDEAAEAKILQPVVFSLGAYPNPFNPETRLVFDLPHSSRATLRIFDILGREAGVLFNGPAAAGTHTVRWNAATLPSGTYIAVLETPSARTAHKLLMLK